MRLAAALVLVGAMTGAQTAPSPAIRLTARAVQPGEVVVLTVEHLRADDAVTITAMGRALKSSPAGATRVRAWLGLDLDVRPGTYAVTAAIRHLDGTETTARTSMTVGPKAFPTRRLTVEPRFVEPPAAESARIAREAKRLDSIWSSSTAAAQWSGPFVAPVPDAANSAFGSRSVFNGQARSPHGGADFASPAGRPVTSPGAGRVVLAGDLYFTGQTVVVDHGLGLVSLFAHLSAIDVAEGATIAAGEHLGRVGATGRVTGPHLHWTVRLDGARVDPLSLVAATTLLAEEAARER